MTLSLAKMVDHTAAIYARAGEQVTYTPTVGQQSTPTIILTRQSALSPQGVPINTADGEHFARIQKADIALPVRGDTITDADSNVYTVQDVDDNFNESENEVQLRQTA